MRSDLVLLKKIWFETHGCYGADDMLLFSYKDVKFDNIIKFDGSYVLRFYCVIEINGNDGLNDIYSKEMAEKYNKKEAREGAVINFEAAAAIKAKEELDISEDLDLLNKLKNNEATD
jgi:hypothetical protein